MRPLRSFLLLLIFLACFTGLHYIIPANQLFPSVYEFIPAELIRDLISESKSRDIIQNYPSDTVKLIVADTPAAIDSIPAIPENPVS